MKKYEYKVCTARGLLVDVLNEYGNDGWVPVQIVQGPAQPHFASALGPVYNLLLVREVEETKPKTKTKKQNSK